MTVVVVDGGGGVVVVVVVFADSRPLGCVSASGEVSAT